MIDVRKRVSNSGINIQLDEIIYPMSEDEIPLRIREVVDCTIKQLEQGQEFGMMTIRLQDCIDFLKMLSEMTALDKDLIL